MTRPALALAHPPALLRTDHAAAYLGISASLPAVGETAAESERAACDHLFGR